MASQWPNPVVVDTPRSTTQRVELLQSCLSRHNVGVGGNRTYVLSFVGGECFLSEALPTPIWGSQYYLDIGMVPAYVGNDNVSEYEPPVGVYQKVEGQVAGCNRHRTGH